MAPENDKKSGSEKKSNPRIERTRLKAFEGALSVLAARGFSGCTFEAIAEKSGVSRSTLYRHWDTVPGMLIDALRSQSVNRQAEVDTGNLRDDMLISLLGFARGLRDSDWGAIIPQLIAAGAIDPDIRAIQMAASKYHQALEVQVIERAKARGEVDIEVDAAHAALLFGTPILYRHIHAHQSIDDKWVTDHVDRVVALLRPR